MLHGIYRPGEIIPQQIWVSWDCVECDNLCEAVLEEGEIFPAHAFCYRCGAKCLLPHYTFIESGEYDMEDLIEEEGITFEPEDDT